MKKGKCYFNKNEFKSEERKKCLSYRIVNSLIKNNIDQHAGFYQRVGYAVVGPILYGYCKWLAEQVKQANINKIFFLAREGHFLKRGFDLLNIKDIKGDVIQVSRTAVVGARLHKAENMDDLLRMINFERESPMIEKMLGFCRIEKQTVEPFLTQYNLDIKDTITSLSRRERETVFQYIKPDIERLSREQEHNLKGYLAQTEFGGRIAVSDVGWSGTIQNELQNIFPNNEIIGYYVGKEERYGRPKIKSSAFLFDSDKNHKISQVVMGSKALFELFFLSVDGSASHYERDAEGRYICRTLPPEQTEATAKCMAVLQDSACDFVRDFKWLDDRLDIDLAPCASSAGYRTFITHISNDDILELKRFSFLNIDTHLLTAEHSLGWYILRPSCFYKEFMRNGCKVVFLKSILKIPLPYVQIISYLKKIDEVRKREK